MTDTFDPPSAGIISASGQRVWIADYSGLPIETQAWSGDRFVKVWISGQHVDTNVTVQVSGVTATISVSGNPVMVSGEAVRISGQTVYPVSGKAYLQVFDPSGQTWRDVWTDVSGGNKVSIAGSFTANVSGQPVTISGNAVRMSGETVIALISGQTVISNANISGNVIYIVSGQNPVQISGQTVVVPFTSISGNNVVVPFTSISGNVVRISGETVSIAGGINVSGSPVRISGEVVYPVSGFAFNKVFDPSGVTWNDWWVDASGSNRPLVAISGQTILTSISGNTIVVPFTSISGNMVSVSGQPVAISGSMVSISGQPVSVSGNAVRISGSVVYPVSGNAYLFGFDQSGATWNEIFVDTSGGHRVKVAISGDTVQIAGGVSVSGNMVSISGQPVSVSGNVVNISGLPVSVSGNMVSISGQPVSVSGNMVSVSGQAVSVSGNAVRTSGEKTRLQAFDPSGSTWNDLIVNQSGGNVLRVDAGAINVASNVSGNVVYLTSGQNAVQNSGQTVYPVSGKAFTFAFDPSGQTWNELWVSQSGGHDLRIFGSLSANVSGNVVYLVSGQNNVQMSGQTVYLTSGKNDVRLIDSDSADIARVFAPTSDDFLTTGLMTLSQNFGYDPVSNLFVRLRVTASGQGLSGVNHKLIVGISGDPVSVSGQAVTVSGNVVNTSGMVNNDYGTVIRTTSGTIITSLSGGTELGSGVVINLTVRNLSGNAPMYIGGTGSEAPFSGKGMILFGNESQVFDIDNFNKIRLFANTSGQRVRVIGVAAN